MNMRLSLAVAITICFNVIVFAQNGNYSYYVHIDRPSCCLLSRAQETSVVTLLKNAGIPTSFGYPKIVDYHTDFNTASSINRKLHVILMGPFKSESEAMNAMQRLPNILPREESNEWYLKYMRDFGSWNLGMYQLSGFKIPASPIQPRGPAGDGFSSFFAQFRQAIRARNQSALRSLTSQSVIWGQDGTISRDQAFRDIGQIISWNKFWASAGKAVTPMPTKCKRPYCENLDGYHIFARTPFPLELFFQREYGTWVLKGFLGD
jgi:hypothetical protein